MSEQSLVCKSLSAKQSLALLERDLAGRINPERSRRFSYKSMQNSQALLMELHRAIAQALGKQQGSESLRISLVGSNAKGSTAFYLAALASLAPRIKQGVGLFTSPHLSCVLERIRLVRKAEQPDNKESTRRAVYTPLSPIAAWEAMSNLAKIIPGAYERLSYFEILTLLAFYIFRLHKCPVEIYEAGLGGRFDATRIFQAEVVVLCSLAQEHTHILGESVEAIMQEKLAILSPRARYVFVMPQQHISREKIALAIETLAPDCRYFFYEGGGGLSYLEENQNFARFVLEKAGIAALSSHRPVELALPGRLEKKAIDNPTIAFCKELIFDTAHNPAAIERTLHDIAAMLARSARESGIGASQKAADFSTSLLVLALLKERKAADCIQIIERYAIGEVWQLICGPWASYPACPKFLAVPCQNFLRMIAKELPKKGWERVLFLGSHRSYDYFLKSAAILSAL